MLLADETRAFSQQWFRLAAEERKVPERALVCHHGRRNGGRRSVAPSSRNLGIEALYLRVLDWLAGTNDRSATARPSAHPSSVRSWKPGCERSTSIATHSRVKSSAIFSVRKLRPSTSARADGLPLATAPAQLVSAACDDADAPAGRPLDRSDVRACDSR